MHEKIEKGLAKIESLKGFEEGSAYKNKDKGNRGELQIGGGEFTRYICGVFTPWAGQRWDL